MSFELRQGFRVQNGTKRDRVEGPARSKFFIPKAGVSSLELVFIFALIFMSAGPWGCPAFAQTDLNGMSQTFINLSGNTGITNNGANTATAIALNNSSTVYTGVIQDGTGVTGLTVYGAPSASLTLTGQNTFSGGTQVGYNSQSGALIIGPGAQIGDVSVLYGSSLTNNGTIGFGVSTNNLVGTVGNVTVDGTSTFANSGAVNGTVGNAGSFTNNSTGTVAGLVTNSAGASLTSPGVANYGALNGGLTNQTGGFAVNYNGGTIAGVITNAGTFDNGNGGIIATLSNTGTATNEGSIVSDATVLAGTLRTTGTISGGVINSATVNAAGTINGAIQNNGGTFTVTGGNLAGDGSTTSFTNSGTAALFVTGGNFTGLTTITNTSAYSSANGGSIQIAAGKTLSAASLTNGASTGSPVTITDAGTLMLSGNLTNYATGVIDVTATGSLTAASFTNWGAINMAPGASTTFSGDLINNSTINMWNGSPTDVTKVTGNYSGDGALKVDINTFTDQSDRLVINGTALSTNGTTSVYFNVLGNGFVVALPVVTTGKGTDATAFSGSIPDWGTISYSFVADGNNWVVKSYLNHSFGPLADISGSLSSISAVFQQPASSYVGDKSNAKADELFCGTWARTDFDRLTVHSSSTVAANGAPVAPLSTSQNISYTAIEGGLDCGVLRAAGTAWNAHLGLIGGEIDGSVNQTDGLGTTGLHVPVAGAYAFFRNSGFVFDLSVRESFTNAEFTIAQAGLQKTPVDGTATTVAAYSSYTSEVHNNLLLMPYAGLSWTRSELSDFEIYTNVGGIPTGRVAPNTNEDSVGRLGFQLSYVQQFSDTFYLRPFTGISGWHAFENGTSLKYFVTNGTVVDVTTPTPKDFMQIEGGLSFAESSIQASGYVKGIYKEGPDIKGESIVLGGRFNF
jgi:hypothetical protein